MTEQSPQLRGFQPVGSGDFRRFPMFFSMFCEPESVGGGGGGHLSCPVGSLHFPLLTGIIFLGFLRVMCRISIPSFYFREVEVDCFYRLC